MAAQGVFSVIFASPSRTAPKHHNEVVLESALGSVLHSQIPGTEHRL
jgi:hypothetical protein